MDETTELHCPRCGSSDLGTAGDWQAINTEDENFCLLLNEYQCHECGGAFWV